MKISVSDDQNEPKVVEIRDGMGSEVNSAAHWAPLVVIFLAAFLLVGFLVTQMDFSSDEINDSNDTIDTTTDTPDLDDSVELRDADNDGIIDTGSEPATGPVTTDTP